MELKDCFDALLKENGSDIHLVAGEPPVYRVNGELRRGEGAPLADVDVERMVSPWLQEEQRAALRLPTSMVEFTARESDRIWRGQIFRSRGQLFATLRPFPQRVPTLDDLGFSPDSVLRSFTTLPRGLILVTGARGSGKTTTTAAMVEEINATQPRRILTVEAPPEYLFESKRSVITQQQLDTDVVTFRHGLITAFRADLDVVFVGEIRDPEVFQLVLTLAETSHLVFATVHTESASETVRRLVEIFPESQRPAVRRSLSRNLAAIVSQRLLPRADRRARVAANEILVADSRIRRMIVDGVEDLSVAIDAGRDAGMQTMDNAVLDLYRRGIISRETAWANLDDLSIPGAAEILQVTGTNS